MSYAWQPIEQAKENGLFKKFRYFWVWTNNMSKTSSPEIYDVYKEDFTEVEIVAPIQQRPRPARILHTGKITEDK